MKKGDGWKGEEDDLTIGLLIQLPERDRRRGKATHGLGMMPRSNKESMEGCQQPDQPCTNDEPMATATIRSPLLSLSSSLLAWCALPMCRMPLCGCE